MLIEESQRLEKRVKLLTLKELELIESDCLDQLTRKYQPKVLRCELGVHSQPKEADEFKRFLTIYTKTVICRIKDFDLTDEGLFGTVVYTGPRQLEIFSEWMKSSDSKKFQLVPRLFFKQNKKTARLITFDIRIT